MIFSKKLYIAIFFLLLVWVMVFFLQADFSFVFKQAVSANLFWGALIYILLEVISIVVAPVATIFLIPLATSFFGPLLTAVYSIFGWAIGSLLAFQIARHWGRPVVKYFFNLNKLENYRYYVSHDLEFWTIVLLRLLLPVDILSYILGLFSHISLKRYFWATIIGITPFAFIFSYSGAALMEGKYAAASLIAIIGLVVFMLVWLIFKERK